MRRLHLGPPPVTTFYDGGVRVCRQRFCLLHVLIVESTVRGGRIVPEVPTLRSADVQATADALLAGRSRITLDLGCMA